MTRFLHVRRWPGQAIALLALFALVARLSAAMPAPVELTLDALLGTSICHGAPDAPADAPVGQHAHDCLLCPACLSVAPVLAASTPASAPAPSLAPLRFVLPQSGAGPPPRAFATAQPRAPPHFA